MGAEEQAFFAPLLIDAKRGVFGSSRLGIGLWPRWRQGYPATKGPPERSWDRLGQTGAAPLTTGIGWKNRGYGNAAPCRSWWAFSR